MSTYQSFNSAADIVTGVKTKTYPMWADSQFDPDSIGEAVLTQFYTSSAEKSPIWAPTASATWDSSYFWNIYSEQVDSGSAAFNVNSEPQFSIAYGTNFAVNLYSNDDSLRYTYPSYAVYRQFANLLNPGGSSEDAIPYYGYTGSQEQRYMTSSFFISIARSRLKDGIDPVSFALNLNGTSRGRLVLNRSGSQAGQTVYPVFTEYSASGNASVGIGVGVCDISKGIIALDASRIWDTFGGKYSSDVSQSNQTGSTNSIMYTGTSATSPSTMASQPTTQIPPGETEAGYIPWKALETAYSLISVGGHFEAKSTELVQTTNYFVRATHNQFNYSENPTWTSGSEYMIRDEFRSEPKTYITSVGLYDGDPTDTSVAGTLIAIAKLSKPIPKDQSSEALIRVRLDF